MGRPSSFGLGLEPEFTPEDYPINIRFVCQGMVKVPKEAVPDSLAKLPAAEILAWAREYWATLSREELLRAVAYLDIEEDSNPGAVEVNDGDGYEIVAQTREWVYFNEPAEVVQALVED